MQKGAGPCVSVCVCVWCPAAICRLVFQCSAEVVGRKKEDGARVCVAVWVCLPGCVTSDVFCRVSCVVCVCVWAGPRFFFFASDVRRVQVCLFIHSFIFFHSGFSLGPLSLPFFRFLHPLRFFLPSSLRPIRSVVSFLALRHSSREHAPGCDDDDDDLCGSALHLRQIMTRFGFFWLHFFHSPLSFHTTAVNIISSSDVRAPTLTLTLFILKNTIALTRNDGRFLFSAAARVDLKLELISRQQINVSRQKLKRKQLDGHVLI